MGEGSSAPPSNEIDGGTRDRSTRWTWLLLTYGLAGVIVYRLGFLGQGFGEFADIFFLWLGSLVFYVIVELSASGLILAGDRWNLIPPLVPAVAVAGVAIIFVRQGNAWEVVSGTAGLVVFAALAMLLIRPRSRA